MKGEKVVATARRTRVVGIISRVVAVFGAVGLLTMLLGTIFGFHGIRYAIWPILGGFILSVMGYIVYREGVDDSEHLYNLESFLGDIVYLATTVVAFAFCGLPWAWLGTVAILGIGLTGFLLIRTSSLKLVNISFVLLMVALLGALATIPLISLTVDESAAPVMMIGAIGLPLLFYGWVVRWRFITEMCAEGA
jgi:hypothetical protein